MVEMIKLTYYYNNSKFYQNRLRIKQMAYHIRKRGGAMLTCLGLRASAQVRAATAQV